MKAIENANLSRGGTQRYGTFRVSRAAEGASKRLALNSAVRELGAIGGKVGNVRWSDKKWQANLYSQRRPGQERDEPTVSVVIPAKNEALNLPRVFAGLERDRYEVILVDGGSTDDTVAVARILWPDIIIIKQNRRGKGNALACGFEAASGDFIVMIDADGSNDPKEIPRFIDALKQGADFAKGSRFMSGAGSSDITRLRQYGNYLLNKIVNVLYGTRYSDLCYGYNAFRRDCLSVISLKGGEVADTDGSTMLWGDGFEVETLINVRIAKAGLRVAEVPSFESNRHFGASNLNAFSDGVRVLRTIHAERKRGTRRTGKSTATTPRAEGASWAGISVISEEAPNIHHRSRRKGDSRD